MNIQVLVTGGGGFLGQALCRALVERGYRVTSFNRGQYPHLTALGVRQIQGDLADRQALMAAARGSQAIFHTAAKAGAWGRYADYYRANVTGTENVLAACCTLGIARLIHTSTPSVTHHAAHPVEGGTADDVSYAENLKAAYAKTKQIAEKMVLAANSPALATVALRPRLIWGPGDPHLMPRLVARARQGRLRLIGDGQNRIDTTYIDNAVQAHLDAFIHLSPGATCAGRAYFISNAEPWPIADIINALLNTAGVAPITGCIPFWMAYAIGAVCEGGWSVLRLNSEPPMTRFLAEQLSTTHWYSMEPAWRDFGYQPKVSIEEGLQQLRANYNAS